MRQFRIRKPVRIERRVGHLQHGLSFCIVIRVLKQQGVRDVPPVHFIQRIDQPEGCGAAPVDTISIFGKPVPSGKAVITAVTGRLHKA